MDNLQTSDVTVNVEIENYLKQKISLDESTILDINIHESINDNTTHGDITLLDIGGFEERIPIIGQERININFSSKSNKLEEQRKHFIVYNMSAKFIDESRKQAYSLFFVSEEYISNLSNKVARSYKSKFGWEIVTDVYSSYVSNNVRASKTLFADGEKNLDSAVYRMQLVMAHFRPFECINLVAKRSVPARGLGKFLFYEDKYGHNFKSIESLLNPKSNVQDMDRVDDNATEKVVQSGSIELEENAVVSKYVLMPANALNEDDNFEQSAEDTIIQNFKFESTFNVIANIVGGMYSSRLMTYDPVTHRVGSLDNEGATESIEGAELSSRISNVKTNFYDFDYGVRYQQFTHVKGRNNPLVSKNHYAMNQPNSCYKFMTTNFERSQRKQLNVLNVKAKNDADIDNQVERWLLPNLSQNRQLKNIVLSIKVAGDHARTVGELVNVNLPSSYFPGELHKYYSGNYLISELSHKIVDGQYFMDMKLVKDSLSSQLINLEEENLADFVTSEQSRLGQVGDYNDNVGQDITTTGPNFQRAYRGGGL
tara:strand:+ start:1446 stop:3065 length:1620 start_codon:yes stop_codon:yes gene_type:complete